MGFRLVIEISCNVIPEVILGMIPISGQKLFVDIDVQEGLRNMQFRLTVFASSQYFRQCLGISANHDRGILLRIKFIHMYFLFSSTVLSCFGNFAWINYRFL